LLRPWTDSARAPLLPAGDSTSSRSLTRRSSCGRVHAERAVRPPRARAAESGLELACC
jgi:hypothetical protein